MGSSGLSKRAGFDALWGKKRVRPCDREIHLYCAIKGKNRASNCGGKMGCLGKFYRDKENRVQIKVYALTPGALGGVKLQGLRPGHP